MGIIIGIDAGGSTTKIVGFSRDRQKIAKPMLVKANDPQTSIYGALGKFTSQNGIGIDRIDRIMITGVGSASITEELYGIRTRHVTEFTSIGLGGLYLSGFDKALVVSMGTGTATVFADGGIEYLGGTGVGGGTLIGLSRKMLDIQEIEFVCELAKKGRIENIDLRISDITQKNIIPSLPGETTAANFGKVSDVATKNDIALGIINLVFETVGMMSVFAARYKNTKDIVLTGNLTRVPQAPGIFGHLSQLFDVNFVIPENAQFGTVIGAALSYFRET